MRALAVAMLLAACMAPVQAQPAPASLRFEDGSAAITGGIVRGAKDAYEFTARPGQHLSVSIKAPAESAVFRIYRPGYTLAAANSAAGETLAGAGPADETRSWNGTLNAGGRYLIVVGAVRSNASYKLFVRLK
jgi:hypothetical protein